MKTGLRFELKNEYIVGYETRFVNFQPSEWIDCFVYIPQYNRNGFMIGRERQHITTYNSKVDDKAYENAEKRVKNLKREYSKKSS